jgi:hypothetical protein
MPTMPANSPTPQLRDQLAAFVSYHEEHLTGDEKVGRDLP